MFLIDFLVSSAVRRNRIEKNRIESVLIQASGIPRLACTWRFRVQCSFKGSIGFRDWGSCRPSIQFRD